MIAAEHILMLLNMVLMVIVLGLAATALGALVDPTKQIVLIGDASAFKLCRRREEEGLYRRAGCDRLGIERGY